jgi:hypothetical protein
MIYDTDEDHPLESILFGHPERDCVFCVTNHRVLDGKGHELFAFLLIIKPAGSTAWQSRF